MVNNQAPQAIYIAPPVQAIPAQAVHAGQPPGAIYAGQPAAFNLQAPLPFYLYPNMQNQQAADNGYYVEEVQGNYLPTTLEEAHNEIHRLREVKRNLNLQMRFYRKHFNHQHNGPRRNNRFWY